MSARWRAPLLVWVLLPIPVAGWIIAQGFIGRIGEFAEFTAAYVHTLATSTFAVVLATSAIINAVIVTRRFRDFPASYSRSYPVAQGITIGLSLGWLAYVVLGEPAQNAAPPELILGLLIAASSVVSCVFAARNDPVASARRLERAAKLLPERARAGRRARIVVPAVLVAGVVVGVVLAQTIVVVHRHCSIYGTGDVNGAFSFYTETCGDFAVDESRLSRSEIEAAFTGDPVDVTSQGYEFGLPPRPVAIAVSTG